MKMISFRKCIVFAIVIFFIGASVVPNSGADNTPINEREHPYKSIDNFDEEAIRKQINDLNELSRGYENVFVMLDWTDGVHSSTNMTYPDSQGYYEMHAAEGTGNISSLALIINGNETLMLSNATGDFTIQERSCTLWKNLTLYYPNHTATIQGHVYDNESNPLSNAGINVMYSDLEGYFYGFNMTSTNETGFYELHLPPSLVMYIFVEADGYELGLEMYFMIGEETQIHDFALNPLPPPPLQYVKGYIRNNESMDPIEYATVSISESFKRYYDTTMTNESGYYEFNVPIGNYTITASRDDFIPNSAEVQVNDSETKWVDILLDPFSFPEDNAWVEGYIYDSGRSPIENAEVSVYGYITYDGYIQYDFSRYALSDQNGYYNISVPTIEQDYPLEYSELTYIDVYAPDYFDNDTSYGYPESIIEPGDVWEIDWYLDPMPEETCIIKGYINIVGIDITPPNNPPYIPSDPNPYDGEIDVSVDTVLCWTCGDPDPGDTVTYDVYFGTTNPPPQVVWGQSGTTYDPGPMNYETQYLWKIVAWDNHGLFTTGLIWSFTTGEELNNLPIIYDENPENGATDVARPPAELSAIVEDAESDIMDVYIRWMNHDGEWVTLESYRGVYNGTYNTVNLTGNDWIWGDTTYTWSVNVTDGTTWTNETYCYTTGGSRYDVNNDDSVNFQDAGLVWVHRTSEVPYDEIYDVNQDGTVNFQDAGLTWINRD